MYKINAFLFCFLTFQCFVIPQLLADELAFKKFGDLLNQEETNDFNFKERVHYFRGTFKKLRRNKGNDTLNKYFHRIERIFVKDNSKLLNRKMKRNKEFYQYFDLCLFNLISFEMKRSKEVPWEMLGVEFSPRLTSVFVGSFDLRTRMSNYVVRRSFIFDFSISPLSNKLPAVEKVRLKAYTNTSFRENLRRGFHETDRVLDLITKYLTFSSKDLLKDLFYFNEKDGSKVRSISALKNERKQFAIKPPPPTKIKEDGEQVKQLFGVPPHLVWGAIILSLLGVSLLLMLGFQRKKSKPPVKEKTFIPFTTPFETNHQREETKFDPVTQMMVDCIPERYDQIFKLSRGGMGVVFCAQDTLLRRRVAIKMISPELCGNDVVVARFINEARSVASLDHPNILKIYDVGAGKFPYFVMEFLEGVSLEELLSIKKKMSSRVLRYYGLQVSEALRYCHNKGIIHRDIKPANIIAVNQNKYIKLIDFGIAKDPKNTQLTSTNVNIGSPIYMAPEQFQNKSYGVQSDIYSFGLTLYRLASGKLPFDESNYFDRVTRDPIPIKELQHDLNPLLSALIMKCIEKDLNKRFENFEQVHKVLEKVKIP